MAAPWHRPRLCASAASGEFRVDDKDALFRNGRSVEAWAAQNEKKRGIGLRNYVYVQDQAALAEATDLIRHFGEHASMEAASRANHSRSLGNVIHFCRWRQIGRAIEMLSDNDVTGAIH
jgi:hypothetical protein